MTQARLRVVGRCRERFRPCRSLASNWPRGRSVRNVLACKVREGLRAQTREGLEPQVDVALALCLVRPSGVSANNDVCIGCHFSRTVFLRASTDLFSWYCSASCDAWRHMLRRTAFPARAWDIPSQKREDNLAWSHIQPAIFRKSSNSCSERGSLHIRCSIEARLRSLVAPTC